MSKGKNTSAILFRKGSQWPAIPSNCFAIGLQVDGSLVIRDSKGAETPVASGTLNAQTAGSPSASPISFIVDNLSYIGGVLPGPVTMTQSAPINGMPSYDGTISGAGYEYDVQLYNNAEFWLWWITANHEPNLYAGPTKFSLALDPVLLADWADVGAGGDLTFSQATYLGGVDSLPNGDYIGQMARVGDSSPYQWYRWDGTIWDNA